MAWCRSMKTTLFVTAEEIPLKEREPNAPLVVHTAYNVTSEEPITMGQPDMYTVPAPSARVFHPPKLHPVFERPPEFARTVAVLPEG